MIFSKLNVTLLLNKLFFFQRERKTNFQEYFVRLKGTLYLLYLSYDVMMCYSLCRLLLLSWISWISFNKSIEMRLL